MSIFNVQNGSLQTALTEVDNIKISVPHGRRCFSLNQGLGDSLTMEQMVRAVEQYSKNGENVSKLKRKITILELQGKAKLANEPLFIRLLAYIRKTFGNFSFNNNLHLNKLDSLPSTPLTDECKQIVTNYIEALNEWKSTEKDSYATANNLSELTCMHLFFQSLPLDPNTTLGKKRAALINKTEAEIATLKDKKCAPSSEMISKIEAIEKDTLDLSRKNKITISQRVSELHPFFIFPLLNSLSIDISRKLEILSQVKIIRPIILKSFKMTEHY